MDSRFDVEGSRHLKYVSSFVVPQAAGLLSRSSLFAALWARVLSTVLVTTQNTPSLACVASSPGIGVCLVCTVPPSGNCAEM